MVDTPAICGRFPWVHRTPAPSDHRHRASPLPGPRDRPRPLRQGHQLGDGTAAHCHPQALTGLDPAEHGTDVVAQLTSGNIGHGEIVASLLRLPYTQVFASASALSFARKSRWFEEDIIFSTRKVEVSGSLGEMASIGSARVTRA